MVFESIIAEVLNKFLGDYVQNLDRSQLKIGIWGGDVVLKDLELKPSALDELDLPFKAAYGRLGKLVLKIPWKNLYTAPVVATIERLFILAVPHTDIKYDEEKEENYLQDCKQAELQRVETAKKVEKEKDQPKAPDTFAEKLVTQIIKNVQVEISDIHVRYEDHYCDPDNPFAVGVTLRNITVHSTDENWKECIITETVSLMIYKVLRLESLAVYWNCFTSFLARETGAVIEEELSKTIYSKQFKPSDYKYILGPINLESQLQINPKPETDGSNFSIPKLRLGITLERLALALSREQYQALIMLLESLDSMARSATFRKYRPEVPYRGHSKDWWKFAYTCVLETEVRRRRRNWDWNHMHEHRELCREYADAYRTKLSKGKTPTEVKNKINQCEKSLDVFNIVLIRQMMEVKVERDAQKPQEKKGWFAGWFSSSTPQDDSPMTAAAIAKKLSNAMTAEEKQKLFQAIDYQENALPTQYPKEFVEIALNFELKQLAVQLRDDAYDNPYVLTAELNDVALHVDTRPAADALRVLAAVDSFNVYGMKQGDILPQLVSFKPLKPGIKLLDLLFETNPLDGSCDKRLQLTSRPLEIVYDAETINKIGHVFHTPESLAVQQLKAAAGSRLSDFKEMSAVGLLYAIDKHPIFDINIAISPSHCILPTGGLYNRDIPQDLLIVNLGHLSILSVIQDRSAIMSIKEMYDKGYSEEEILETMTAHSYDKFMLHLTNVQILLALEGEDWEETLQSNERSTMHLLEPTSMEILMLQCLISDDPRLPKFRVEGLLPSLTINVEDERVLHLASLAMSVPLPYESEPEVLLDVQASDAVSHIMSVASGISRLVLRESTSDLLRTSLKKEVKSSEEFVQFTDMKMNFVLKELQVFVFKKAGEGSERLLDFKIFRVALQVMQRTFELSAYIQVGSVDLNVSDLTSEVGLLSTPMAEGEDRYMFLFKYSKVDRNCPEFHTKYGSVIQLVQVYVTGLALMLHQEALLALWEFVAGLQSRLESIMTKKPRTTVEVLTVPELKKSVLSTIKEEEERDSVTSGLNIRRPRRHGRHLTQAIDIKINSKIFSFHVELLNRQHTLAQFSLEGGIFDVSMKKSYTEISIKLKNLSVRDPNPRTKHHEIMSVMGEEAFSVQVILFDISQMESDPEAVDMSVVVKTSPFRVVYVNAFVQVVLNFIHSFKTMQEILQQAAKDAAEAALQNVQDAYVKATHIAVSIDLQAPVIIIPASSKSLRALTLDLGTLTIKNRLETLDIRNERGDPAIIDEISIGLHDMKVSRVTLTPEGASYNESKMLKPISCTLMVKRNITCSWYSNVPYIDCSGRLETVVISLSDADFDMIKRIPSENLAETGDLPLEVQVEPTVDWQSRLSRPKNLSVKKTGVTAPSYKDLTPTTGAVATMVKFTFTMDSLILDLFSGVAPVEESEEFVAHPLDKGLARFSFNILSLKGHMYSDGTLSTSVLLVDCLLDDTRVRPDAKISRLMQRKEDPVDPIVIRKVAEESFRSMLDITFQKKGPDIFVDVRVFGFDLVLSSEYLMKIADFFVGWSLVSERESGESVPSYATLRSSSSATKPVPSKSQVDIPEEAAADGMMTLNLRIEKPDIIMVENMDDIDSSALVLNMELTAKVRLSNDHKVICGSIKDLQLYSYCYNPKKREETTHQILRPCCISLAGSTPGGEGMHLDICLTPVKLSVSPDTIELLFNVQRELVIPQANKGPEIPVVEDYSNLWQPRPFREDEFWYFRAEMATEAADDLLVEPPLPGTTEEMCIISAPTVLVTVEVGVGQRTLPMILMDISLHGAVHNWSSNMYMDTCLSLEMKYYNSKHALWEPLVEPAELNKNGELSHVPWELRFEVQMNPQEDKVMSPTSNTEEAEEIVPQSPTMSITVSSNENLEVTLTKTCLDVLYNLSKAFQSAVSGELLHVASVAPFSVKNDTGLAVAVQMKNSFFHVFSHFADADYREVMLESGAKVDLVYVNPDIDDMLDQAPQNEDLLQIKVIERNCVLQLPVRRADKRYFSLKHRGEGNEPWGLISDVQMKDGGITITLRSIIQVHNHFNVPVNVYYMTKRGNEVECIGAVEPNTLLNLPLYSIYTPTNELFFSVEGYTVSVVPFIWKDLQNLLSTTKMLQCESKKGDKEEPFFMKIVGELEQVFFEGTTRHTMLSTCYNIHLRSAVVIKNHLPVDVMVCLADTTVEMDLASGDLMQLPTAEPGACSLIIRIPEYLEKEWSCRHELELLPNAFTVWTFYSYDSMQKVALDLGMRTLQTQGSLVMTLYCPYWMLNKTGLMLMYRKTRKPGDSTGSPTKQLDDSANVLYHPANYKGPILFSFRAKSFFGKKKASVKVEDSDWSDKFPLDVAGSSGVVHCRSSEKQYKVGVYIQLTYSTLTKQVTFTPYYVLINNSKIAVEVQEAERPADPWIRVEPGDCKALWPCCDIKHLRARVADTQEITATFGYDTVYTSLLRLDNQYGGLNVDIQITEGSVYIGFMTYEAGLAPALIVNHLDVPVTFNEEESQTMNEIEPMHCLMYTWANPLGPRRLKWTTHQKKRDVMEDLRKDGIDQFSPVAGRKAYWVSFLDGLQRVLLFTYDTNVAKDAQCAGELEQIDQEITVSIHGMGFSLVNNITGTDALYCGFASSGVIWETCKPNSKRYKPLNIKDNKLIEEAYVQYQQSLVLGEVLRAQWLPENKYEVDFELGEILKPHRRKLRRTYQTGLWFQMKTSKHQMQLHAKINRLQIDNQVQDCLFPVVLGPVPPPRSMVADSAPKPFFEVSIVRRLMEHSPVVQYKYFKVLVQEFHVKLDLGFITALVQFFEAGEISDEDEKNRFLDDRKLVDDPLMSHALLESTAEQKNFYDLLHFSPLKIHLTFSLSSTNQSATQKGQEIPAVMSVLLQSLGVTLTDIQDIVFMLAYFERQYSFLTQRQLMAEAKTHYIGQALKQLYVLVLGLDVLGNPYGLVLGVARGVEDLFYEPFQGAIQGPGEFAEGLVLGVRSLFGHTVGGAAGAVSRITGAMGKGVAALTFDKDYQRKRLEAMKRRPKNIHMGLAQGGKGIVMGVVDGVSGVFTKPITGAREEGVEGFFKGVGKGVVGLVTRPTAGIFDFASGTLEQVKRVTDPQEELVRLRPPRFMHPDGQVRAYVRYDAEGNKLLKELEKGRYNSTDVYAYHVPIVPGTKDTLLMTDKRVMYVVHNEVFGGWQVEWDYTWESLAAAPLAVEKGIFLTTGEPRKKVLGIFGGSDKGGKLILIRDSEQREWLVNKMKEIMKS